MLVTYVSNQHIYFMKIKTITSLLITLTLLVINIGCVTTQSTAAKLIASTATTVDNAMKGWATFVVIHGVSEADQQPIRNAYATYQHAMLITKTAYSDLVSLGDKESWAKASTTLSGITRSLIMTISEQQSKYNVVIPK